MMLKGEDIHSKKMVSGHKFDHQRQPAGFDLTVESVWSFDGAGAIDGDNSKRKLPNTNKLEWMMEMKELDGGKKIEDTRDSSKMGEAGDGQSLGANHSSGRLRLSPGCYKIIFNETVAIPADCAAIARPRSSLLRMGATVHTALWDPGYTGRSEALLQVLNPAGLTLYKDAKVVQLSFVKLEGGAAGQTYTGAYQGEHVAKK